MEEYLDEQLIEVNEKMHQLAYGTNKIMNNMVDWALAEKGKQLRPRFLLATAFYCAEERDVTEYAAILELLHIATLIHDDVIDRSDYRRGRLSIQKKFGVKSAVYLGDYILFSILKNTTIRYEEKYNLLFDGMQKLCDGELGQNENLYNLAITKEEYLKNIEGKTAALFEIATKAGAILCESDERQIDIFMTIGRMYGVLFQIRDDLLDVLSNDVEIGKPIFQDFYNGIYTLPVIFAGACDRGHQNRILQLKDELLKKKMTKKHQQELLQIILETNSLYDTYKIAREYYEEGMNRIKMLNDSETTRYFVEKYEEVFGSIMRMCRI